MNSLRLRISIAVVGITSAVVLVAAIGIWLATRAVLIQGVDRELHARSERVHRMDAMGALGGRRRWPTPPTDTRNEHPDVFRSLQLVDPATHQDLLRWPPSAPLPGLDAASLAQVAPGSSISGWLSDGHHVRVLAVRITRGPTAHEDHPPAGDGQAPARDGQAPTGTARPPTGDERPAHDERPTTHEQGPGNAGAAPAIHGGGEGARPDGVLALALLISDLDQVDGELRRMGSMLAALWLVATLLAWGAVLLVRSTILRPLGKLVAAIDRLGPDDLSARVPATVGPDEVRGLTQRLNVLLDRLEQAFRHEQATIASVAHELRTPVTSLRMAIEFRLMASPPPDESRTLATCLETVEHMQEMVANLLLLARLEAGKEPLQRQQVDVAVLAAEVVESWDARAAARQQTLVTALPERAMASTSDLHLRLIVGNLIGNAIAHGLAERDIDLAVEVGAGAVRVVVGNPFAGTLDAGQLGKSFYRGDDARSGSDHCGLGLALCRRLARLLGGELALSAADGRFVATLTLATAVPDA